MPSSHDPADRYSAQDTIRKQGAIYLTTGTNSTVPPERYFTASPSVMAAAKSPARCASLSPRSVGQVVAQPDDVVSEGDKLLILESMQMETAIVAPVAGRVDRFLVAPGMTLEAGQPLAILIEN